jgi:hypothetical protein
MGLFFTGSLAAANQMKETPSIPISGCYIRFKVSVHLFCNGFKDGQEKF